MKVTCDLNCINNNDDECQLDEIVMSYDGCESYEEVKSENPEYTEIFYAFCRIEENEEHTPAFKRYLGKKESHWGRDMFEYNGSYTDAKTGYGITEKALFGSNEDQVKSIIYSLEKAEAENELSPLYTDNPKYQVVDQVIK